MHYCRLVVVTLSIALHISAFAQGSGQPPASESNAVHSEAQAAIDIRSLPTGADIYFDTVHVGKTPLLGFTAAPGAHTIALEMTNYAVKRIDVRLTEGRTELVSAVMMPAFGFLSMETEPADARIDIDSGTVFTGAITAAQISLGRHTIRVSHPDRRTVLFDSIDIAPGTHYQYRAPLNRFLVAPILYTAVVPGLGQFLSGSHEKGAEEFLGTAAAAAFMFYSINHYKKSISDYHLALERYAAASNEIAAFNAHRDLSHAVSTMKSAKDWRLVSQIGLGACYALTLLDAIVNHSVRHGLTLTSQRELDYPTLKEFIRSPTIRIGITATIR